MHGVNESGDRTLGVATRPCANALRVRNLPLSPQHLRLSLRPAEATLDAPKARHRLRFESISSEHLDSSRLRSAETTTSKPAMPQFNRGRPKRLTAYDSLWIDSQP